LVEATVLDIKTEVLPLEEETDSKEVDEKYLFNFDNEDDKHVGHEDYGSSESDDEDRDSMDEDFVVNPKVKINFKKKEKDKKPKTSRKKGRPRSSTKTWTWQDSEDNVGEEDNEVRPRKDGKTKYGRDKMAQCPFCDYKGTKSYVKTHIGRVHDLLQCPHCDFHSNTKSSFSDHIKTSHPSSLLPFMCEHCKFSTKTEGLLTRHILIKHPDGKKLCKECRKFFPIDEFEDHVLQHQQKMEICNICGKMLKRKSHLNAHIKTVHQILEKKYFCEKCNAGFALQSVLNRHMKLVHSEKYPCPLCGEKFFEHKLKRHIADLHTPDDQKKYQCKDCGKGFNDTRRMESHQMNVHLKLQPYKCRYGCDIAYNDISNRNQHEKKKHGKLFTTAKEEKIKEILGS